MTRTILIAALVFAFGWTPEARAAGAGWDAKAAAELKAQVEKFMDAWVKQDTAALKSLVGDDMWGAWDLDMAMKPASWATKAEMNKFFDEAMAMVKKMGGAFTWKTT